MNTWCFATWGKGSVLLRVYAVQFPDLSVSDDQAFMIWGRHPPYAREPIV